MASVDPSLIADPREQKWVGEISEIVKHQLEIKVEIPPVSIFKIPENITKIKPEAYKPQQIGFGPYHHFQPGPYTKMEQKKLVVLQKVLQYHKIKDFRLDVLDKVENLVPVIRACYEMFLQDDNVSLAWVSAIDGLFLLNLFETYDNKQVKVNPTQRLLAQDIMMVENQIPFMVLKEIHEALNTSSGTNFSPSVFPSLRSEEDDQLITASSTTFSLDLPSHSNLTFSPSIFRSFSEIHSPLELCSPSNAPNHVEHLLHYMYDSIINNDPLKNIHIPVSSTKPSVMSDYIPPLSLSDITNSISHVSNFLKKVPEKEIAQLYEQTVTSLQNFSKHKITIHSASKLQGIAGFEFHDLPKDGGVENVYMDDNNIYLPRITLNNDSEVILRNLVAYETLMPNSNRFPLNEYMGLMCGLIVNVEDVKLLKKDNIIKGDLGEDEVAKLFIGVSSSIMSLKTKKKSDLQEMIDQVNNVYERKPRIKAYLPVKKLANWLLVVLTTIGGFVGATWKIVAFMVSIVTVFMLTYQAYCDVYGCDNNKSVVLSYASS
ncbi:hypothetical protein HanRHA438_Chr14g0634671 [Helianthus annuus]|uniref:Uncharacterized protein n=1 Tax=Helianthus annuus TaxID=4232 RepID=A0A251SE58_HELAN|nr:putative UPF0481 protein At3g02645 [Helianthus annuus]KAF5767463.1 hypothetical protein HanXRQr2_Chr14g0624631 [Helianthus annuus]KAJ0466806.1 hypothetical protein HanIR_Chr14g0676261 [Helianthus annuus]KAJ0484369.1 hypothetical protein HanHA89_Chr14g0543361 [Helianthus annuus]KAJ0658651.1 hypothetical protein HanOQP8_Chr14g0510631 [Helianthus annuus]KAJ0838833.1 hypothetical protein HanPSC8_Chr14g0599441 [Helianthus annuus]